jgi:hypothetical protein
MPPIEPPTTQNSVSIPRRSISMVCARTMSGIVMTGKSSPHTLPVAGLVEAGPVEPMQPPMTLEQMMKYLSVSSGRPGPTMVSHQPGLPVTGWTLATC